MYKYRKDAVKKKKPRNKARTCAIIFSAAAIFMTGYLAGVMNRIPYNQFIESHSASASMLVPAVDDDGVGVLAKLTVQTAYGSGRVLVNMDKTLFWDNTRNSMHTSSKVASNIAGVNLSKYDIIYNIETGSASVEGLSAGAALAIATVASLTGKEIDARIVITGTINEDGTIGHVSHVLAKAKAAKEAGMSTFLVPSGQVTEIIYETRKYCEQAGPASVCTTQQMPVTIDIAKETGIEIKEVKNIEEALVYFFGGDGT